MVLAVACALIGVTVGSLLTALIDLVPAREPTGPAVASWLRRPRFQPGYSPWFESSCGLLFAAAAIRFGADWALPAYLVFFAALLVVTVIDLEHFIVPNRIVVATLAVSLPLLIVAAALGDDWSSLRTALLGALAAGGSLLIVNLISPRGMGMGDVKLAVVLGLFLGWIDLAHVLLGLFLGFLLGALGGVMLMAVGRRSRSDHLPFAPFLAGGAVLAVLLGGPILRWYL